MWELEPSFPLPADIAAVTTSIWRFLFPPHARVGVMRLMLLGPPVLWLRTPGATPLRSVAALRMANLALDELQQILEEPEVMAEAEFQHSHKLLPFLSFRPIEGRPSLYLRSI